MTLQGITPGQQVFVLALTAAVVLLWLAARVRLWLRTSATGVHARPQSSAKTDAIAYAADRSRLLRARS